MRGQLDNITRAETSLTIGRILHLSPLVIIFKIKTIIEMVVVTLILEISIQMQIIVINLILEVFIQTKMVGIILEILIQIEMIGVKIIVMLDILIGQEIVIKVKPHISNLNPSIEVCSLKVTPIGLPKLFKLLDGIVINSLLGTGAGKSFFII